MGNQKEKGTDETPHYYCPKQNCSWMHILIQKVVKTVLYYIPPKRGFFSESAIRFSNLQKKIFQKPILSLKFKFPYNNTLLLLAGNSNFKFRIVFWNIFFWRFEKRIFLEKATFNYFLYFLACWWHWSLCGRPGRKTFIRCCSGSYFWLSPRPTISNCKKCRSVLVWK